MNLKDEITVDNAHKKPGQNDRAIIKARNLIILRGTKPRDDIYPYELSHDLYASFAIAP